MSKLLVFGIDGLGYDNALQHFRQYMPNLNRIARENYCKRIELDVAISPRNWVRIFSGRDLEWYNLYVKRVRDDVWRLIKVNELGVRFIWDEFPGLVVINAPVVIPPVCKNTDFRPVQYGLPFTWFEAWRELNGIRRSTLQAIRQGRSVIAVTTVVDRMLHITGNERVIRRLLIELDEVVRQVVERSRERGYSFIIVSDHGMRRISGESQGQIVPRHDMPHIRTVVKAIHAHSSDALYISSIGIEVNSLLDVYRVIRQALLSS